MYVGKRYKPGSSRPTLKILLLSWKHGPAYPTPNCYNLSVFSNTMKGNTTFPETLLKTLFSAPSTYFTCPESLSSAQLFSLSPLTLLLSLFLPRSSTFFQPLQICLFLPISWILHHKTCLITCQPHDTMHVCDFTH